MNFTENRPDRVKSEIFVKNKENKLKKIMKNFKRKGKKCSHWGLNPPIICLKPFHAQSKRGGKFEILSSENISDITRSDFMRFPAGYFNILAPHIFEIWTKKSKIFKFFDTPGTLKVGQMALIFGL
jgi:hypothetical protein